MTPPVLENGTSPPRSAFQLQISRFPLIAESDCSRYQAYGPGLSRRFFLNNRPHCGKCGSTIDINHKSNYNPVQPWEVTLAILGIGYQADPEHFGPYVDNPYPLKLSDDCTISHRVLVQKRATHAYALMKRNHTRNHYLSLSMLVRI